MDLFELKIKELKALKKEYHLDNDILFMKEKDNVYLLGCKFCYLKKPEPTFEGYRIEAGNLVNYYEKFLDQCTVPKEIAVNAWLCPHCSRLFKELLPNIEFVEINNVSI